MKPLKRIAVTGPESTGKSRLAEQLALHYNTIWVSEYAREYIEKLHRPYNSDDILEIAKGQYDREMKLEGNANGLLFCDTEFIVLKIWYEHFFKTCPDWILDKIRTHVYDLYLLTNIDLPWEPDPQREHPGQRKYFFNIFLKELKTRNFNYRIVSGEGKTRLDNSIKLVDEFIQ